MVQYLATLIAFVVLIFGFDFLRENISKSEFDPTRTLLTIIIIVIIAMVLYTWFIVFRFNEEEIIEAETIIQKMFRENDTKFTVFVNNELLSEGDKLNGRINTMTVSLVLSIIVGVVGSVSQNLNAIWFETAEPSAIRPDKFTITFFILTLIVSLALLLTFLLSNLRNRNLFYETLRHMKLEGQVRTDVADPLQMLMDSLKNKD